MGSTLLGTVLAVVALCGTAVFGASLTHLTATPRLYGDPFQLNINDVNSGGPDAALLTALEHDHAVTGITEGIAPPAISINGVAVNTIAGTPIRGPLLLSSVDGHVPNGDGQIALGATTMRQVGAHLGSSVRVTASMPSGGTRTEPLRVVAQVSFPAVGGGIVSWVTVRHSRSPDTEPCVSSGAPPGVVPPGGCWDQSRWSLGPRGHRFTRAGSDRHYLDAYRSFATLAIIPTSLINFGEAVNFPLIFGAMLAAFGAATLAHLLVVSVARRRREASLLKVPGVRQGPDRLAGYLASHNGGRHRARGGCTTGCDRWPSGVACICQ